MGRWRRLGHGAVPARRQLRTAADVPRRKRRSTPDAKPTETAGPTARGRSLPPPLGADDVPPLYKLGAKPFQSLCRDILETQPGVASASVYGTSGQRQHGIDVLAHLKDGGICVAQAKCYEEIAPRTVRKASDEYLKHLSYWEERDVRRFILMVACDMSRTQVQDQIAEEKRRFRGFGLEYEAWDVNRFAHLLGQDRTLTHRYLGQPWADKLCGGPSRQLPASPASSSLLAFAADPIVGVVDSAGQRELDAVKNLANEGRRDEAVQALQAVRNLWPLLQPQTRARTLRMQVAIQATTTADLPSAKLLLAEADALDPAGMPTAVHARVTALDQGSEAALTLLRGREGLNERNARAGFLVDLGHSAEALEELDLTGTPLAPDAETHRVKALAYFCRGELALARLHADRATEMAPAWAAVRYTAATIGYFSALSAAALPGALVDWPRPVGWELVRRDDESASALRRAETAFAELSSLAGIPEEVRRNLEAWRLACLAIDPTRTAEAAAYSRHLLSSHPLHCPAIAWALARNQGVPASSVDALARRLHLKEATPIECLTLVALYQQSGKHDRALNALATTRATFERSGNDRLWRFWHAQVLLGAGRLDEAIAERNPKYQEASPDPIVGMMLMAEAERSGEFDEALAYADRLQREADEPLALLRACQLLAEGGKWGQLAARIPFLEDVGTADTFRLAAGAAWHTGDAGLCLGLLERGQLAFPGGQLPADLRGVGAECLKRLGRVSKAAEEAAAVARSDDSTPSIEHLVHILLTGLDTQGAAVEARRLVGRTDLRAESALAFASLLHQEDHSLALALWRHALAASMTDEAVPAAIKLGYALGCTTELRPLFQRVAQIASRGDDRIARRATIDDFRAFVQERHAHAKELEARYRRAEAPLLFIAEVQGFSPILSYQQALLAREAGDDHGMLLARWGGHSGEKTFPATAKDVRLYVDVSALLVAAHFEMLDDVERAFRPIRMAHGTTDALLAIRDLLGPRQPRRLVAQQQVQRLVAAGKVTVGSSPATGESQAIPPELVSAEGPEWAGLIAEAQASRALVVDYLPLRSPAGPLSVPADIGSLLVNCGAIGRSLNDLGIIPAGQLEAACLTLGGEAAELPGEKTVERGTLLLTRAGIVELLAEAGLLEAACSAFRLRLEVSDHQQLQAELRQAEQNAASATWLDRLITRVRDGLVSGRYELLPEAPVPEALSTSPSGPVVTSLLQLLTAKRQPGDALWIEDRAVGRYATKWSVEVVSASDILRALRRYEAIDLPRYYSTLLRLRRGGVYFIPLSGEEVSHHIGAAKIQDGELVETEELSSLRRYFARALESGVLVFPSAEAPETPGEQTFVLGALHAVEDALIAAWKSARPTPEKRAVSSWLWTAFGVHEVRGLPLGTTGPQPYLLVARTATLIANGMKFETADTNQRNEYLAWLTDNLLEPRLAVDPDFARSIADILRTGLFAPFLDKRELKKQDYRLAAARLLGDFIDQLPAQIAAALWEDRSLADAFGRRLQGVISLQRMRFPHPQIWQAVARAIAEGRAELETLDRVRASVEAVRQESMPLTLVFQAGDDTERISEPLNGILSSSVEERTTAMRARRAWFDGDHRDFERQLAEIVTIEDSVRRMDSALRFRDGSSTFRYESLREKLDGEQRLRWADLEAPPIPSLVGRLRLPHEIVAPGFSWALHSAAEVLVREEGLIVALERLAALPTPLPQPILEGLGRLAGEERRSLLLRFSRSCVSPIRRCHVIRILLQDPGDTELLAAARTHVQALIKDAPGNCLAFLAALGIAERSLAPRPGFTQLPAGLQLALPWMHADALYSILREVGALDKWIESLPSKSEVAPIDVFLRRAETWRDIASHRQLAAEPLLLFGLAFAVETAGDTVLTVDVREGLVERITREVDGTRLPVPALLLDRELGRNVMDSFLRWRPSLERLVGPVVAKSFRPETLESWVNDHAGRLAQDPNDMGAWRLVAGIVGHFSTRESVCEKVAAAAERIDFTRSVADGAEGWRNLEVLLFLCAQYAFQGAVAPTADPAPHVRAVARALNEASSRVQPEVVEKWAGALLEACAWARLVEGKPEDSARGFADLFREVAQACPPLAAPTRNVVQHLADRLPIDQGKYLWRLLTLLRTFGH